MEKSRQAKNFVIGSLLVCVVALSIAFAAISTTLNITGTVNMPDAKWDVKFTAVNVDTATGNITTTPTWDEDSISYTINVGENSNYEFDATITNAGTYDAVLKTLNVSEVPEALQGVLTYQVTGITQGSTISHQAGSNTATVHVKVSTGKIDTAAKLAAVQANPTVTLTVAAEYEQVN